MPAPIFRPTLEEFRDPVAYLRKISAEGCRAGIALIAPPDGWERPELSVAWKDALYDSYRQNLHAIQSGNRDFAVGGRFTVKGFRERCMALGRDGNIVGEQDVGRIILDFLPFFIAFLARIPRKSDFWTFRIAKAEIFL